MSRVEKFAESLPAEVRASVGNATSSFVAARRVGLAALWGDRLDEARRAAGAIKEDVLERLPELLAQFERSATAAGATVHWARDAAEACAIVLDLARRHSGLGDPIVKAKSMATEEIHLNHALEAAGFRPVETDLGEFVVQLDHDTPSHIVAPIIHKNRRQIGAAFAREGIGSYSENAEELTARARAYLREKFRTAKVGISGANFLIAESGRIVLIENEGNNRLSTTAPNVHICVAGIEKILPRDADLPLFLRLLACSSTGQRINTYTHFIHGPRKPDEPDGPEEVHIVLLDNGRSRVRQSEFCSILRCIRCGACLNVCPVYRQSTGHAYGHVYSGPVGAVLAAALEGADTYGDLADASSLCGACEEVCPVTIPIPDMLLRIREKTKRDSGPIPWKWFGAAAGDAGKWRAGLKLVPLAPMAPHPLKSQWTDHRDLPKPEGRSFRRWWNERS